MENVKTLKASLDGLIGNIESIDKNLDASTRESTTRLAHMLEKFTTSFSPVQQSIGQFGQTLSSLETMAVKIESAGSHMSGAAGEHKQSTLELGRAITGLSASLSKVEQTAINFKSAGGIMTTAASEFKDCTTSMSTGMTQAIRVMEQTETRVQQNQKELNALLITLQNFADRIPVLLSQYEERFKNVDGALGKTFGELTKGSEEFRASTHAFVRLLDEQFGKTVRDLRSTMKEIAAANPPKESSYLSKLKSKLGK